MSVPDGSMCETDGQNLREMKASSGHIGKRGSQVAYQWGMCDGRTVRWMDG